MKKKLRYCSLLSLRLSRAYRATIIKTESKQSSTGLLSWWV